MNWLTTERKNWIGGVVAAALIGFSIGNGHTTQNAIEDISAHAGEQQKQIVTLKKHIVPLQKKIQATTKSLDVANTKLEAAGIPPVKKPN